MSNFLDARGFTFAPFMHPFHEEGHGDSGTLELATSKKNPDEQYIIKSKFPELGCNEFMYHRVANIYMPSPLTFNHIQFTYCTLYELIFHFSFLILHPQRMTPYRNG